MKPVEKKTYTQMEQEEKTRPVLRLETERCVGIIIGSIVYAIGFNLFLTPEGLYAGGFMGVAQLVDVFLRQYLKLNIDSLELPGVVYYVLNIPWLFVAYRSMRRRFVVKTLLAVTLFSGLLTLIPSVQTPILEETIANTLVAGLMCGVGIGIVLRMGASDGGMDLLGMIVVQKKGRPSVGKINLIGNCLLYSICLFIYDVPIVIYSLVYMAVLSFTLDKVHIQNINVRVFIITQMKDYQRLELEIMGQIERGVTRWRGTGAFSGKDEAILMVVASKYEVRKLRAIVFEIDPKAFILTDEGVGVVGNFPKKLT